MTEKKQFSNVSSISRKNSIFQPARGTAKGGPYICAHLRRKDYLYARKSQLPDLKSAADQLIRKCQFHKVDTVYLATDAPQDEIDKIKDFMEPNFKVKKYQPDQKTFEKIKDGGVAILDQIICSKAKYFVGSTESTFTFRIQEEREIMGFDVDMTFDILCPSGEFDCKKGSVWKIVYPDLNTKSQHTEL